MATVAATLPEIRSRRIVEVRALGDGAAPGTFEALVAVFNNVDSYGDRILPGAFKASLAERGFPAVVWSHMWNEPPIGATLEAEEVDAGLRIVGQLLIDDNARAREVWAAMKTPGGDGKPPLREFSFAFFVKRMLTDLETDFEPVEPGHFRDLLELDTIEVGPTLLGANPATQLLDVAAHAGSRRRDPGLVGLLADAASAAAEFRGVQAKAGAVLSSANRGRITAAIDALNEVLADAESSSGDGGKSKPNDPRAVAELIAAFPAQPA